MLEGYCSSMYKFIMGPALVDVYVVVSQKREPLYRPQYSIILIMGTPNMVLLILGNPHVVCGTQRIRESLRSRENPSLSLEIVWFAVKELKFSYQNGYIIYIVIYRVSPI